MGGEKSPIFFFYFRVVSSYLESGGKHGKQGEGCEEGCSGSRDHDQNFHEGDPEQKEGTRSVSMEALMDDRILSRKMVQMTLEHLMNDLAQTVFDEEPQAIEYSESDLEFLASIGISV